MVFPRWPGPQGGGGLHFDAGHLPSHSAAQEEETESFLQPIRQSHPSAQQLGGESPPALEFEGKHQAGPPLLPSAIDRDGGMAAAFGEARGERKRDAPGAASLPSAARSRDTAE